LNFSFYIARRYLMAKKSHNAINIITLVSLTGVMVGTMALIVILSVFNGFEKLILSLFNAFNPDMEITLREGKRFSMEDFPLEELKNIPGMVLYSEVLEETALLTYRERQHLVKMRGVGPEFRHITGLDTLMVEGEFLLKQGDTDFLLLGQGVAYMLGANINDYLNPLHIYVPRRGHTVSLHPAQAFNASTNYAGGIFAVQAEFDMEYVIVPLRLARRLLQYEEEVSSIALRIDPSYNALRIQQQIESLAGPQFVVKNRLQQQAFLYKVMKSEKWAIFFILTFILVVAAFNVIGSLTMLVIEKKRDIHTLHCLGASASTIRKVFLAEGLLISLGGAMAGLLLGGLICWLQMQFGIIAIQAEGTFIIDAYPVALKATDFLLVGLTVAVIGLLASIIPANYILQKNKHSNG
jgi:lipoprotein-releasing system permease protein